MHTRTRRRLVPVALALVLAATACTRSGGGTPAGSNPSSNAGPNAGASPATARFYDQKPTWAPCDGGLQCANVTVPVDWAQPAGATLQLAVARRPGTTPGRASLLLNPGGPGESGLKFLREAGAGLAKQLGAGYDLVAWDPRGTGASAPVKCLPDDRLDALYASDSSPDTPAEVRGLVTLSKEVADACKANSGPVLAHVDTLSSVRDMDVLRAVLGAPKLDYLGFSYGTSLGTWYAETFPSRVGRFVLDSALDPAVPTAGIIAGQAEGFSRAVRQFVAFCLGQKECSLHGTTAEGVAQIQQLLQRTDAAPLRTSGPRPLTQDLMGTGIALGMYDRQLWPITLKALASAAKGDGTLLLAMADYYNGRNREGGYDRSHDAQLAINCLDHGEKRSLDEIAAAARAVAKASPPLGAESGWSLGCTSWPYPPVLPVRQVHAKGTPPILVIGVTNDPATPYAWSKSLARQLDAGVLLTRRGEGHIGYLHGSTCLDRAVTAFLLAGTVPKDGTVCS
jgi:pimeloyl-ACP methyl ester carboxylesterase